MEGTTGGVDDATLAEESVVLHYENEGMNQEWAIKGREGR